MQDIHATTAASGGMCVRHGELCKLPSGGDGAPLMLYAAGFSCKNNSLMNPGRFSDSPLRADCETASTFSGAYLSLLHLKPMFFALENVSGARQGCLHK